MSVTAKQVAEVGARAGNTAACQVVADAINAGGGGLTATLPLAITAGDVAIRAATNAVSGSASAAQITALEGLQHGLAAVDTIATGAASVSTGVTFLNPAGDVTFTLANGTNGQIKTFMLVASHTVTITGVSGWTGKAAGDYVRAVYSTLAGGWGVLDSRATP